MIGNLTRQIDRDWDRNQYGFRICVAFYCSEWSPHSYPQLFLLTTIYKIICCPITRQALPESKGEGKWLLDNSLYIPLCTRHFTQNLLSSCTSKVCAVLKKYVEFLKFSLDLHHIGIYRETCWFLSFAELGPFVLPLFEMEWGIAKSKNIVLTWTWSNTMFLPSKHHLPCPKSPHFHLRLMLWPSHGNTKKKKEARTQKPNELFVPNSSAYTHCTNTT